LNHETVTAQRERIVAVMEDIFADRDRSLP